MRGARLDAGKYVQYGCGWFAPQSWINYDASPTLWFERIPLVGSLYTTNEKRFPKNVLFGDILKGLPVGSNSCRGVYCSHVLEHLALQDLRRALVHTYRMLEPGGIFRFVMPDLEYHIKRYCEDPCYEAAIHFMKGTLLGAETRPRGIPGFLRGYLGNSRHLWMWDYKSIERELHRAGFVEIRRAALGDAPDRLFDEVEEPARWENCLGVQCCKPIA